MEKLGEVCNDKFWIMPSTPKFLEIGEIPYITTKNIKNGKLNFENVKYISQNDYETLTQNRNINKNDILISMIGTIGEIALVDTDIRFYGQNLYLLRLNQNLILNKYFYYYFTQTKIKNSLISKKNTSSQGYIRAGQLENLEIPIPPLETQKEIVRILDTLTEYMETLKLEREQRRKQYEYYLNYLLSEEYLVKESIEIKREKLGDCTLKVKKIKWNKEEKSYKYIDLSSIDREKNKIIISEKITKETALAEHSK